MSHFIRVVGFNSISSLGSGQYSLALFFSDSSQAKFLRVGDEITDSALNRYTINSWIGQPSDFISAATVTVTFATNDVLPVSAGFDATAGTPGQENLEPELKTVGTIGSISSFSGQNFEYTMQAAWNDNAQASNAQVGDSIVDSNGKEYTITFLDSGLFSDPFRVTEVEKVGQTPASGTAVLSRATSNFGFFQGDGLSDTATDIISGRDAAKLDNIISSGGDTNGDFKLEDHELTATNITNKNLVLNFLPKDPSEVEIDIPGGTSIKNGTDFTVSGSTVSWNATDLDGFLEAGDCFEVKYFT